MNRPSHHACCSLALALTAALATGGCVLDRSGLAPGWGEVSPTQFCPGDEVTVSYDFLRTETCRDESLCATYHPTVTVTSDPSAFPPQTATGYANSFSFMPTADTTSVSFDVDRDSVRIPTIRVDGEGRPIDAVRDNVGDEVQHVSRLTGSQDTDLFHDGICAGTTPMNVEATLPGPPRISPNLRLVSLCNRNGVPVEVTLSGGAPGATYGQTLMPGQCLDTSAPGVPAGTDAARVVAVRSLFTDPSVRCSATGPSMPPPPLRTLAVMACR